MTSADLGFADLSPVRPWPEIAATLPFRESCEVAVIGAGPYGLAVAAYLKAAGVHTRAFGETMGFWRRNMPKGMRLRSPWRASHIGGEDHELSLDAYAKMAGTSRTEQMPIADFVKYGDWFQARAIADLDPRKVVQIKPSDAGFRLVLDDANIIQADRVVVAMGLANQSFRPPQFAGLRSDLVSHSSEHSDFSAFRGRRVAVVGRGQSACESAVLLCEAGADVELVSRGEIHWIGSEQPAHAPTHLARRLRAMLRSKSEVGPFLLDWLADAPGLVRHFPLDLRNWVTLRCLRPAATAWLRPRARGIRFTPGRTIADARSKSDRVVMAFDDGSFTVADHVVLATGYRIDIAKLGVISPDLLARVERIDGSPRLRAGFESSVPGLHFVGSSAVKSYGPLMRFIAGAGFAAHQTTQCVLAGRS